MIKETNYDFEQFVYFQVTCWSLTMFSRKCATYSTVVQSFKNTVLIWPKYVCSRKIKKTFTKIPIILIWCCDSITNTVVFSVSSDITMINWLKISKYTIQKICNKRCKSSLNWFFWKWMNVLFGHICREWKQHDDFQSPPP